MFESHWKLQTHLSADRLLEFKNLCKERLSLYYKKEWKNSINNCKKCSLYKFFKTDLTFEKYLIELNGDLRICLTKFRLCNHKLPIELGRHMNIIRNERICVFCNKDLGDEYHYVFSCDKFINERHKFIPKVCIQKPSSDKFCQLMGSGNSNIIMKLAKFTKLILKAF